MSSRVPPFLDPYERPKFLDDVEKRRPDDSVMRDLYYFYGNPNPDPVHLDWLREELQVLGLWYGERTDSTGSADRRPERKRPADFPSEDRPPKRSRTEDRVLERPAGDFYDRATYLSNVAIAAASAPASFPDLDSIPNDDWGFHLGLVIIFVRIFSQTPAKGVLFAGVDIGSWVAHQQKNANSLSRRQVELFTQVPGISLTLRESWEFKFDLLSEFVERFGCFPLDVARDLTYKGVSLSFWLKRQYENRHHLDPSRIARLEALPGWRWPERS